MEGIAERPELAGVLRRGVNHFAGCDPAGRDFLLVRGYIKVGADSPSEDLVLLLRRVRVGILLIRRQSLEQGLGVHEAVLVRQTLIEKVADTRAELSKV